MLDGSCMIAARGQHETNVTTAINSLRGGCCNSNIVVDNSFSVAFLTHEDVQLYACACPTIEGVTKVTNHYYSVPHEGMSGPVVGRQLEDR